jgi:hypothetical protein
VLASFDELPDFSPVAIVIAGSDVYAGGVNYPNRVFDEKAPNVGRLVRIPTTGGAPREVWKGPGFGGALRAFGSRIVFAEIDPTNVPSPTDGHHGGLDVFDSLTEQTIRVPNAAGRDYVASFEIGAHGIFWSGGSLQHVDAGTVSTNPGFTMAHWRDEAAGSQPLLEADDPSLFFRRGDDVLANVLETSLGEKRLSVHRAADGGFELERELSEVAASQPGLHVWTADADFYYVATPFFHEPRKSTSRIPRVKKEGVYSEPVAGVAFDVPLVDRGVAFWVPETDRSMVRRRRLDDARKETPPIGEELALDPRREIGSLVADDCNVYWLSRSTFDARHPYRIMVHAR